MFIILTVWTKRNTMLKSFISKSFFYSMARLGFTQTFIYLMKLAIRRVRAFFNAKQKNGEKILNNDILILKKGGAQ